MDFDFCPSEVQNEFCPIVSPFEKWSTVVPLCFQLSNFHTWCISFYYLQFSGMPFLYPSECQIFIEWTNVNCFFRRIKQPIFQNYPPKFKTSCLFVGSGTLTCQIILQDHLIVQVPDFSEIDKCVGLIKAVQEGFFLIYVGENQVLKEKYQNQRVGPNKIFEKNNKICCMIIWQVRVIKIPNGYHNLEFRFYWS